MQSNITFYRHSSTRLFMTKIYIYIQQGLVLQRYILQQFTFTTLSSQTKHYPLVVSHCHNSSVLSPLSALLALYQCVRVSAFPILVQFFQVGCDFSTHEKHKKPKQLTLHSVLMSSEPQPGPSSAKLKVVWLKCFIIICVIFYIPNSLN